MEGWTSISITGESAGVGFRCGARPDGRPRPNSEMPDLRTPPTLPPDAKLIFTEKAEYQGVPGEADGQLPSRKWCQPTTGQSDKTCFDQNFASQIRQAMTKRYVLAILHEYIFQIHYHK